jgi:hypothetical protein
MAQIDDWQQLVIAFKQIPELVLKWLSYQCFENRNTFNDENGAQGQRNLGKRELILLIREWMAKDPEQPPENLRRVKNEST